VDLAVATAMAMQAAFGWEAEGPVSSNIVGILKPGG
jgi:hypothetical protein